MKHTNETGRRAAIFLCLAAAVAGCATTGPGYVGPKDTIYEQRLDDVSVEARWFSGIVLGESWANFNHVSLPGRLVASPSRLAFVVEDQMTGTKFVAWQSPTSGVTWITGKNHGVARILQLQANGGPQSFLFNTAASDGSDKDRFLALTLSRFAPKQ